MKPHYRLHCNFGDVKPLWWATRACPKGVWNTKSTLGYSSAVMAIRAAANL